MATEGESPSSAMNVDRETVETQPQSPKIVTPFPLAENLLLIAKNSEPEQAFSAYISDIVPDVTDKKLDTEPPFSPFVVNEREAAATEALSNQEELDAAVEALNVKDEGLDVIDENGGGVLEDSLVLEETQESTTENGESIIVESLSFEETLLNVPDMTEAISENGTALTVEEALKEGGKSLERTETDIDLLNNTSEFETLIELVGIETVAAQDVNGAGEEMSGHLSSSENGSKFAPTNQLEPRNVDGNASAQKSPGTSVSGQKTPEASIYRGSSTTSTPAHQQNPSGTSIVGDILYSIATGDEEGRNRQRILAFAAKRYANNVERNPEDHDALYNWALVLQESADNAGPEVASPGKDALLEEACKKYDAATRLCPFLHEAFYNWAIAISDRAKIRGRTKEAEDLWKQACDRYDQSVQLNWNSPQALNNWGLALQELGAIVPAKEKRMIVKKAIRKFRAAIQLRFDFHRAVYNLGTVLYGLAEDTLRSGRKLSQKETKPAELYSQSAIYIATAHALKPDYPVYRSALRLVRSMLPLPYLKAGWIIIPPDGNLLAPHSTWERLWFVLDHEALYEIEKIDRKALAQSYAKRAHSFAESHTPNAAPRASVLRLEMEDVVHMAPCSDLSLPPGGGFCIDTISGPQYLIADTWESMEAWVDAIRLVYTIYAQGKRDALAGVLAG